MESYKHLYAKKVLAGWLRECAAEAGRDSYARLGSLSWRVNRDGPYFGVWEEYPFAIDRRGYMLGDCGAIWDETDCGGPNFDEFGNDLSEWEFAPPTYDDLVARNYKPYVILDVAIQAKGQIVTGIEVYNKHAVNAHKIKKLQYLQLCELYEIDAEWILQQTQRPDELEFLRCVTR